MRICVCVNDITCDFLVLFFSSSTPPLLLPSAVVVAIVAIVAEVNKIPHSQRL